jgi:hypothetical protein
MPPRLRFSASLVSMIVGGAIASDATGRRRSSAFGPALH